MGQLQRQWIGERFGRLVVVSRAASIKGMSRFVVSCDCGNQREVYGRNLRVGDSRSCGCLNNEARAARVRKHGDSRSPINLMWKRIKQRCHDPNRGNYRYYGGRGITVCDAWRDDFVAFRDYVMSTIGPQPAPGMSLDRINNDRGYEPGNIRWATQREQVRNSRTCLRTAKAAAVATACVILGLWLAQPVAAQGCTSVQPGPTWVCVGGGWLPPGQAPVGAPGGGGATPAQPSTFAALSYRAAFEPGPVETFVPPMVITPQTARTWAGKVMRPVSAAYQGPLVIVESLGRVTTPGITIDYPTRLVVSDLVIHGYAGQTCVEVRGIAITITRLIAMGCDDGLRVEFAVNLAVTESILFGNRRGLHLKGNGPNGLGGALTITTVRISNTRIAASHGPEAVRIGHGLGITFTDHSIIEGNFGAAVRVERTWPGSQVGAVLLRDTWFEANGTGVIDPIAAVRLEGVSGSW